MLKMSYCQTIQFVSNVNGKMEITSSKLVIAISYNNNFGSICSSTYVHTACKISETCSKRLVNMLKTVCPVGKKAKDAENAV